MRMWRKLVDWWMDRQPALATVIFEPEETQLEKGMRISRTAIERMGARPRNMFDAIPLPIMTKEMVFRVLAPPPGVGPGKGSSATLAMDASINDLYGSYVFESMYQEGIGFLGYQYLAQLLQRSEYLRASAVIAEEITRKWGKIQCTGEDKGKDKIIKQLEDEFRRLRVKERIGDAVEMGYGFGKGQLFICYGSTTGAELARELVIDNRKVVRPIESLNLVEPMWTYPSVYNTTDPMAADFYSPSVWYVMSTQVHTSRLLKFVPFPVKDILKPAYLFGGLSLTQQIKPYVDNWLNTRQDVQRVIHSFITYVLKTNMERTLQQGAGEQDALRAELFNACKDNNDLMMLDMDSEEFQAISAPLGSLDKLQAQALEHICSAAGQPVIKFTGISPSGLNASSEGEIDVFYDHIVAAQKKDAEEAITTILQLCQLGLGMEIDPEITWVWNPLKEMTAKEKSDIDKADSDADVAYIDRGVLSPIEVRTKLANKEDSPYAGLDVDDVPDPPDMGGFSGPGSSLDPAGIQPGKGDTNKPGRAQDTAFAVTEEYQEMVKQLGKFDKGQVAIGMEIETEHFDSMEGNELKIMGIVRDHLKEDDEYYTKLQGMEKTFAKDKQFIESEHPRKDDGKFGSGGGETIKKPDKEDIKAGSKKQDYTEALTKTKAIMEKFKGKKIENKVAYIYMAVREAADDKKVSLSLKKDADGDITGAASYYPEKDSMRVSLLGGVGGGSACLASAIEASKESGFGGAITLTPLRDMDTINYYINCGFDVKKGSTDFWLSPKAAEEFLNRGNK